MKEHPQFKIIKTDMLNRYIFKLSFRLIIFAIVFFMYIFNNKVLTDFMTKGFSFGITPLHVIWAIFMATMISHIFPNNKLSMALRKSRKEQYDEVPGYDKMQLYDFVMNQNIRAWIVMLVWLIINSVFGILYLFKFINNADLLMLSVFYYICDYVCILFFCPFQTFIMKNRCCVNCRIYDWGHFMMFLPMLFIKNFFSWSLFFTSIIVLIHWEIIYAKYPERFYNGSNKTIQCANCKDKTCQIKKTIKKQLHSQANSRKKNY